MDAPEHQKRIATMRKHLDAWVKDTGDLGFVLPETKLVKDHIWPTDSKQPTTPKAEVKLYRYGGGVDTVERWIGIGITCKDPGASIGCRISKTQAFKGPWRVCATSISSPSFMPVVPIDEVTYLQVQTHRIGHKPATIVKKIGGE